MQLFRTRDYQTPVVVVTYQLRKDESEIDCTCIHDLSLVLDRYQYRVARTLCVNTQCAIQMAMDEVHLDAPLREESTEYDKFTDLQQR